MKKRIPFMDTTFRDGFQSCFGARVLSEDFLPALQSSVEEGLSYFEAGGGARFQAPLFYCNESAFDMMDKFRQTTGADAELQTLARGISVVALEQQPKDIIDLHAKLFKKHGITTIRNFDALNDMRNLKYSGECITKHGLKHQVTVSIMGIPPGCQGDAHHTDYYLKVIREILDLGIPFDVIAFKDAAGTTPPRIIYDTIKQARKLLPEQTVLHLHTHDSAGIAVAQNLAAIEAGVDFIDLSKSPCSGGTCQVDILVMSHALRDSEYALDVDMDKILKASQDLEHALKDYIIPTEARASSHLIQFSPMPGGALTANTLMMRENKTIDRFPEVIKAMSEVVKKGGLGASVTPVSQFYFQQAYLNVMQGSWKKIAKGYGEMVLGYFGKTPVAPDPDLVKLASEQLGKPPFEGDPVEGLEDGIPKASKLLNENHLQTTEENIFIVAACGQKGLDFLMGKGQVAVPKKQDSQPVQEQEKQEVKLPTLPDKRSYTVRVDGKAYDVVVEAGKVSSQPQHIAPPQQVADPLPSTNPTQSKDSITIEAPMPGHVEKICVQTGEAVQANDVILIMEAMKMQNEIRSPQSGTVEKILAETGKSVAAGEPLVLLKP